MRIAARCRVRAIRTASIQTVRVTLGTLPAAYDAPFGR